MSSKALCFSVWPALAIIALFVSCSRSIDEQPSAGAAVQPALQDVERESEVAQLGEEGARIAAMTRDERRANWMDDVIERHGPRIETFLPELSTVESITAVFTDTDRKNVEISVPKSHWRAFVELITDCQPVELESEILTLGYVTITTKIAQTRRITILSNFANPIIYRARNVEGMGHWEHYATLRSEPEVLAFFESIQDERNRRRLLGWYSPL